MMTAMLTVRNILAGERLFDIWAVNEDAEYHEAGREGENDHIGPAVSGNGPAALSSLRAVPKPLKAA
jgi:hypothetical protein